MQHRPCRHVQHEKDGGGEIVDQEHVHHGKGEGDADDTYQSLTLRHAQGYELVVDMIPVRQEKGLPAPPTVQYDPHHIKHRNEKAVTIAPGKTLSFTGSDILRRMAITASSIPMVSEPVSPMKILRPRRILPNTL